MPYGLPNVAAAYQRLMRGIVSWFGVPNHIITDNGSQFTSNLFKTYCANLGTQICYASVAHPRSNARPNAPKQRS